MWLNIWSPHNPQARHYLEPCVPFQNGDDYESHTTIARFIKPTKAVLVHIIHLQKMFRATDLARFGIDMNTLDSSLRRVRISSLFGTDGRPFIISLLTDKFLSVATLP